MKDIIQEEWEKVDWKMSPFNRFNKMYPFNTEDMHSLETPPLVDVAVMRLARHVTLPMDVAVSFKEPLDRRMDLDMKKAYIAAGSACRPVLALTSLAKAITSWAESIKADLQSGEDMTTSLKLLTNIKHLGDFVGEAAIDSLRCSARAMQSSVMAKRALWLKPWTADISSNVNWCCIPFNGTALFGNKMESEISKVTGGKTGILSQDVKPKKRRFQGKKQYPNTVK